MNRIKRLLFFIFSVIFFMACQSGKSIQHKMLYMQSGLYYELSTPVYSADIINTIYLKPVDASALLPYTTVKRTGGMVLPFLLFNFVQSKYEVTLGEGSLVQPYRDFLMDALLAECNRSSCFNLEEVNDNAVFPDSALVLEVEINENVTTAKMKFNDRAFFVPFSESYFQADSDWSINSPASRLDIFVRLVQQEKCLWEKTYAVKQNSYSREGIEDSFVAYETCINNMTACLSLTTKSIVEDISYDLHLLMLSRQQLN